MRRCFCPGLFFCFGGGLGRVFVKGWAVCFCVRPQTFFLQRQPKNPGQLSVHFFRFPVPRFLATLRRCRRRRHRRPVAIVALFPPEQRGRPAQTVAGVSIFQTSLGFWPLPLLALGGRFFGLWSSPLLVFWAPSLHESHPRVFGGKKAPGPVWGAARWDVCKW